MKKLVISFGIICMLALSAVDVMGQAPVSRTNSSSSAGKSQTTAARQERKGDVQMNKANTNYQKAQQSTTARPATTSTARPATSTTARPSTTSSSTARPAATSTARPSTSSATTTRPATSSTTSAARPATSTTATTPTKPATSTSSAATSRPSTTTSAARPASSSATNSTSATVSERATTSTGKVTSTTSARQAATPAPAVTGTAASSTDESKRGYSRNGVAQPQPAPQGYTGGGANNDPKMHHHTPFMHPNHHNFGGHMTIPRHIQPVYYGGMPYYYYNSVFCTMMNGYYVICRPPLGAVIAYTIFNTWNPIIVVHRGVTYYYDDGTFFRPRQRDYVVVAPPVGALVAELPSNYQTIVLEGRVYYKVDNVYYKEVVLDGYLWYEVLFVA